MSRDISKGQVKMPHLMLICLLLLIGSHTALPAKEVNSKRTQPDWRWLTAIPAFKNMQVKPIKLDALEASLEDNDYYIDWSNFLEISCDGHYLAVDVRAKGQEGMGLDEVGLIDLQTGERIPMPPPDGLPKGQDDASVRILYWDRHDPKQYYVEFSRNEAPSSVWRVRIGGKAERLSRPEENTHLEDVLPDNRLVISIENEKMPVDQRFNYYYQELGGDGKRIPLATQYFYEHGKYSPNGKFKAFSLPGWWGREPNQKNEEHYTCIEEVATQLQAIIFSSRQLRFAFPSEYLMITAGATLWLPDSSGLLGTAGAWTSGPDSKLDTRQIWLVTVKGEAMHISDLPDNVRILKTTYNYRQWLIKMEGKIYLITIPDKG